MEGWDVSVWDLRSDTVTKPCDEMRRAMAEAVVGDDVYEEDPTVRELEALGARLLGKEAALFVASGTMGNLIALLTHCGRGQGAVVGARSHIYNYEGGGMAALGGVMPLVVDDGTGLPSTEDLLGACRDASNVHFVEARLLCLENTHNASGGRAASPEAMEPLCALAREKGLSVHLDGARVFNAAVALGVDACRYGALVDSVQICLSKGLGAPVGSLLCGDGTFVREARKWRKRLGGGMRQAGVLAAAGLVALRSRIDRLAEDHEKARRLSLLLRREGLDLLDIPDATNMIYFRLPRGTEPHRFVDLCRNEGVLVGFPARDLVRLVTHLDLPEEAVDDVARSLVKAVRAL
ncbi:low-specificity L-threonine aldolase [Aminithiophilus ramosus]|uniref:Low-specificity L-threonine aldolase n=2 Tax=Synergistales TaxID=649776 RepID=A0A9Q7ATI6_9BACT|nr:low-specificity L-threonine aldolase [Aminithiophilus ramosus]QVL37544.1 low-specificity L-threonine aldolase [Synergistota bacterium]